MSAPETTPSCCSDCRCSDKEARIAELEQRRETARWALSPAPNLEYHPATLMRDWANWIEPLAVEGALPETPSRMARDLREIAEQIERAYTALVESL
jgi:hypothetical protein